MKNVTISDGDKEVTLCIGMNAKENDELYRRASPSDWWVHLDNQPSAHLWLSDERYESHLPKTVAYQCALILKDHCRMPCRIRVRVCYVQRSGLGKDKTCAAGTLVLLRDPFIVKV